MTTKSIIGRGYIPRNVSAVCLETSGSTRLGEIEYRIIKNPYERTFEYRGLWGDMVLHRQKQMAINVLDTDTGLTYAVVYEPANLVRDDGVSEKTTGERNFIADATAFAERFEKQRKAGGDMDGHSLVIFAAKREKGKVSGMASIIGGDEDIFANLTSALTQNKRVRDHIGRAFIGAQLEKIFNTK